MGYMRWIVLFYISLPTSAFAFFCPTNFNRIDFGASVDQVTQVCGTPDKKETQEVPQEGPQVWSYYIPQTVASTALKPMQGTLKTEMTFDSTGKAVNISVNGIGVGQSTICGGKTISLGDSRDTIKAACGDPSFINKQNGSPQALGSPPPSVTITTFTYNTSPPVSLVFENGKLTARK